MEHLCGNKHVEMGKDLTSLEALMEALPLQEPGILIKIQVGILLKEHRKIA